VTKSTSISCAGKERFALDVKVMEPSHDMDQIAALADPEKNLVPALGILGVEIDKRIAALGAGLARPVWNPGLRRGRQARAWKCR